MFFAFCLEELTEYSNHNYDLRYCVSSSSINQNSLEAFVEAEEQD